MMQRILILGSTGSIGQNTLDVIAQHPDQFRVVGLTAHRNVRLLFQQCLQFKPEFVVIHDEKNAHDLQHQLRAHKSSTQVFFGEAALVQLAGDNQSDTVVAAIVGAAGLLPTLEAVKAGKRLLLANKEALVMASQLFIETVKAHNAVLLPIDSEHNAILQCLPPDFLPGKTLSTVQSIILTASGGPFRTLPIDDLKHVTPAQAMSHPTWQMGAKISVDSATMMNKGLEVIEAFWLFGLSLPQIQVVIHPQSIIHSLVSFLDGSFLAQLGVADMRIPISYALAHPNRIASGAKKINFDALSRLDFEPVSYDRFPCLRLAFQAVHTGGTATAILNAANEVAVSAFCNGKLRFDQISILIDDVLQKIPIVHALTLPAILEADNMARKCAMDFLKEKVYSP